MSIPYNKQIDEENIKKFNKFGVNFDDGTNRYKCVICGEVTCLDNSCSNYGHKLIDYNCANKLFLNKTIMDIDFDKLKLWQHDEVGANENSY